MSKTLKIEYSLTLDDFLIDQLYKSNHSKSIKKRRRNSRFVMPIFYMAWGIYLSYNDESIYGITIFGLLSILWIVFLPFYEKWRYKRIYKKHVEENYRERAGKSILLEFRDDLLLTKDTSSKSEIHYSEFKELVELKELFLLVLTTNQSLIIKKTSFQNLEEFKNLISSHEIPLKNDLRWEWS